MNGRGLTLVEVLVALAILATAMLTALVLYDGARRTFKLAENMIDQQQTVRIAFDLIAADLRMAGYNHNPDGDDDRPDEQIEAAYPTAVVLRADLDAGTAEGLVPEAELRSSSVFGAVTTGNDEIVGYVLANAGSDETLTYFADVGGHARDGSTERVQVPRVALTQGAPPYVLYRVTLDDDASVVKTPIADNIRALGFRYYDRVGGEIAAPGGDESEASRRARGAIRRITIEIEGLTRDPDGAWVDPDDIDPRTRRHRKFDLSGAVTPRNLGRRGLADLPGSLVLPAPPFTPVPVPGHCQGLYVKWSEPPPDEWEYRVGYEDVDGARGEVRAGGRGTYLSGLSHDRRHDVWVRAVDPFGNVSAPTPTASATTSNLSPPREPLDLAASSDGADRIALSWQAVIENEQPIPGDPSSPRLRDFDRYSIYRRVEGRGSWIPVARTSETRWVDTSVTGCTSYDYFVRAEDLCGSHVPQTRESSGMALTADAPRAPDNVEAYWFGTDIRVSWQPVEWTVSGVRIDVERYDVYRVVWSAGEPPDIGFYGVVARLPARGAPPAWTDAGPSVPAGRSVSYRIVAVDGCGNASSPSDAAEAQSCRFTGAVAIATPSAGADTSGVNDVRVEVRGGAERYVGVQLTFVDYRTGVTTLTIDCPSGTLCAESAGAGWVAWSTDWINRDGVPHAIVATVSTSLGCRQTRSILVGSGLGGVDE